MRACSLLFLILSITAVKAQDAQIYNLNDLPQSLMLNPGTSINFDKHLGIPLLSGIKFQAGLTGVTAYDIFQESPTSTINDRIREAIFSLSRKDNLSINQKLEIISLGWRNKNDVYISAGWYQEADVITYFPKDPAILAYNGNANYIGRYFDAKDAVARGEVLSVFHIGINKKISNKLTVGGRAKIYNSMFNFTSVNNEGRFITRETPEGPNFYSHDLENLDILIQTSGTNGFDDFSPGQLFGNALLSGNMGLGIDVGFDYKLTDQWHMTGSLVDLGFVSHFSKTKNYFVRGSYSIEGIEFIFPPVFESDSFTPYFENLEDEFRSQINFGEETGGYTTLRPLKVYGSLDYKFGETKDCNCLKPDAERYLHKVGLQVYGIKRPLAPQGAITAYLDTRITRFLRTKFTYTIDNYSLNNFGFLISAQANKFNLYLAVENLLDYRNLATASSVGIQAGFQFIIKNK